MLPLRGDNTPDSEGLARAFPLMKPTPTPPQPVDEQSGYSFHNESKTY